MAAYLNGRLEAERPHSPREEEAVTCVDCFENVGDPQGEYCESCGNPLCEECANLVNDEPLCVKCLVSLADVALRGFKEDGLLEAA